MLIFQQTMRHLGELDVGSPACKAAVKDIHIQSMEVSAKVFVQRKGMDQCQQTLSWLEPSLAQPAQTSMCMKCNASPAFLNLPYQHLNK